MYVYSKKKVFNILSYEINEQPIVNLRIKRDE